VNAIRKVRWLMQRASVMSAAELAYRFRQVLVDSKERVRHALSLGGPPKAEDPSSLTSLLRPDARQLFVPAYERSAADEGLLLSGKVAVFGQWLMVGSDAEFWHRDPLSGAVWPRRPFRQLDYRPGNSTGDVRVVWELNRLQHLFALAVLADQDPSRRGGAIAVIERQLAGWEAANPTGIGVNFISAMEEALRLVALFHTYDLVREWVSDSTRLCVGRIALSHSRHVASRLSLYSSAGNHTIAEAVGLLYAGILLRECPLAAQWRATARRLLGTEAERQIDADGGGVEQATWYLLFIVDLLGLAQALLRHSSEPPEPLLDAALERGRTFLHIMGSGPDDLPRIGDGDDGYALAAGLRISWTGGPDSPKTCSLRAAGLSVVRQGADDRLLFLHKPLGMAPNFAHGHADCLSVLFRWQGREVFTDPGTYQYGGDPEYRQHFRSTAAHNTVVIGLTDQAEQVAPFMWRHPYQSRLVVSRFETDCSWLLATHDGYKSLGSAHWRGVVYRRGHFLAIWDCVTGASQPNVAIHWNLGSPITRQDLREGYLEIGNASGPAIQLEVSGGTMSVLRGSVKPLRGWRSPSYGSVEPSDLLEIRLDHPAVQPAVTVVWLAEPRDWGQVWPLVDEFRRYVPAS